MNIMIVEDEMLLALELECEVEAAGHEVVGTAASREQALAMIDRTAPDFAFVDIQLQDGPTGPEIGQELKSRKIPFVFVTGNLKRVPDDFAGAIGAIEKPYTANGLRNALRYIESILDGCPLPNAPPSLVLAP